MPGDPARVGHRMDRRRWLRTIAAGVVLGLVGVAAGNLLFPDRTPALLDSLDSSHAKAGEQLTARVRTRFPPGTSEASVAAALAGAGFKVDPAARTASWEHKAIPCTDIARIWWTAEQGKITAIEGLRNAICP